MSKWDEDDARRLLDGVVPEDLLATYAKLIAADGCMVDDVPSLFEDPAPVEELVSRGMAHARPDEATSRPRLVPAPPDLALQGVLAELGRRLAVEQERLLTGHRRLSEANRVPAAGGTGSADQLVEIVTDRAEISRLSYALINAARYDWLSLDNYVLDAPVTEETGLPPLPIFEGHVRCRTIYEIKCAEHPIGIKTIEAAVQAGEQARLLPRIGMKLKVADEAVALLPLTPTGTAGAMLVRSPVIVGALREYFELLWERAVPFGAATTDPQSPLTDTQQSILSLLAQGLPDEVIARRIKLSVNTVRRHITAIREALGVDTRFAAGAAAVRRGWIQ